MGEALWETALCESLLEQVGGGRRKYWEARRRDIAYLGVDLLLELFDLVIHYLKLALHLGDLVLNRGGERRGERETKEVGST